jgi:hypothetical protein
MGATDPGKIPKHNLFTNMVRKDFRITKTTTTVHAETI